MAKDRLKSAIQIGGRASRKSTVLHSTLRQLYLRIVEILSLLHHHFQRIRLKLDSRISAWLHPDQFRILATACWSFPIYSQTFVYQELTQLVKNGFELRFLYSKKNPRRDLPRQFFHLWHARRKLDLHPEVCRRAYESYAKRMPEKTEKLIELVCRHASISREELFRERHFQQAFAFTQLVEAYGPDFLHSYFFYEGSFFVMFASYLLDIPRSVSCYSDHMLQDYALKVVPLHLDQCSLVVATSYQIKKELLKIFPAANPNRIIVKPNAINCDHFDYHERREPDKNVPFRLLTVSRIEPKKGLIYLVESVQLLREQGYSVQAHIVGGVDDDPSSKQYAQQLTARIHELNLVGVVHLEGRKSEQQIKRFLAESHLFIAPFIETESGDKDGIPTSLLEAMASGLPVVATDSGSIGEVIENGRDGVIVPQKDSNALATAIFQLIPDAERRIVLGKNAAEKMKTKFDVEVCEMHFHQRLLQILANNKNPSS